MTDFVSPTTRNLLSHSLSSVEANQDRILGALTESLARTVRCRL